MAGKLKKTVGYPKGERVRYNPDLHPVWGWSLCVAEDMKDTGIAEKFGITTKTLYEWKKKYPELSEALKDGKGKTDAMVEKSLLQRAVGYTYKERKIINTIGKDGKPQPSRIETVEKHVPPDTTAQIYWLKNRKREQWKDKWDIEVDTDKEIVFNIVGASQKKGEVEE